MTRKPWLAAAVVAVCVVASPRGAAADITAFLGASPTPSTRLGRGVAAGAGLVIVGFEFEAAQLVEDTEDLAPGLTTGMANLLVQTPIRVAGIQFYGTTGAGVYRERLGSLQETSVAGNIGGGVKLKVAGPLRLRVDYRLLRLRGSPLHATYHRVYAGANIGF
jgi:hypothetical protein